MITRRGLMGMFAAGVGAAIIRTPGLVMPIRPAINVPPPFTLDDYARRILNPLAKQHAEMLAQAIFYGDTAWTPREFRGLATLMVRS